MKTCTARPITFWLSHCIKTHWHPILFLKTRAIWRTAISLSGCAILPRPGRQSDYQLYWRNAALRKWPEEYGQTAVESGHIHTRMKNMNDAIYDYRKSWKLLMHRLKIEKGWPLTTTGLAKFTRYLINPIRHWQTTGQKTSTIRMNFKPFQINYLLLRSFTY